MSSHYKVAEKNNIFVLTEKGYERCKKFCKEEVFKERRVGKPVGMYVDYAPNRWIDQGWVKEVEKKQA
jgi:hypothetical protein